MHEIHEVAPGSQVENAVIDMQLWRNFTAVCLFEGRAVGMD